MLQSTHVSFRPIDIVMGPDGAVYVADWYSPIIQHGEVDFRDERRDHVHGRIWRITAKDRPLMTPIDYATKSIIQLLDLLKSDANWVRKNAKQELKLRNETRVNESIADWLEQLNPDDPAYEHQRMEALWAYQTISTDRSPQLAVELMKSPDHRARAAAVRVLYHWRGAVEPFERAVHDPHPRVRREAVSALGQFGSAEAMELALQVLDHPMDHYLEFALWRTCRLLEPFWLPAFQKDELDFDGNPARMAFALKAVERPEVLERLIEMMRGGKFDPAVARLIGKIGSQDDLTILVRIVTQKGEGQSVAAARGLLEAAEDRGVMPVTRELKAMACSAMLESKDKSELVAGCRLIGLWKQTELDEQLKDRLVRRDGTAEIRGAAALGLADLGRVGFLRSIAKGGGAAEIRIAAAEALVRVDPIGGGQAVAALLRERRTEAEIEELLNAILIKKAAMKPFVTELQEPKSISRDNALIVKRLVETSGVHQPQLVDMLDTASGKLSGRSPDELDSLASRVSGGDPKRGRAVFNRAELTCLKCHAIKGSGGEIGPDLSSIGAAAPVDYLIESLLAPSLKIKEGYRMSVIVTEDGDVYSGAVVREDERIVVLRNSVGKENRVPKTIIESRKTSPISMMPSALTASLPDEEFLDLIAYLASLGKQ